MPKRLTRERPNRRRDDYHRYTMIDLYYTLCIIKSIAVPRPQPEYDIKDFVKACKGNGGNPSIVTLEGGVRRTADRDFGLKTRGATLSFIASGGLEDLECVKSIQYRRRTEIPPPNCDAYHFKSGFSLGYISFFYSESSKKWVLKSLHRDDACGPTVFEVAFGNVESLIESPEGVK